VVVHDLGSGRIAAIWNSFSGRRVGDESLMDSQPGGDGDGPVWGPYERRGCGASASSQSQPLCRAAGGAPASMLCINLDVSHLDAALRMLSAFVSPPQPQPVSLFRADWPGADPDGRIRLAARRRRSPRSSPCLAISALPWSNTSTPAACSRRGARPTMPRRCWGWRAPRSTITCAPPGLARFVGAAGMSALPPFRLERFFSTREFTARHHMTASDAESLSLPDLLALATPADRAAFETLWLGYTETWGAPDLREAIAETYCARDPADILCFAGAGGGDLRCAQHLAWARRPRHRAHAHLSVPGDHRRVGVRGVRRRADADDDWSLDIDAATRRDPAHTRWW